MHDQFRLKNLVFAVDEVLWTVGLRLYMYLLDFRLSVQLKEAISYQGSEFFLIQTSYSKFKIPFRSTILTIFVD